MKRVLIISAMISLLGIQLISPAAAGEILDAVKARGALRCGVSDGIPGFSVKDANDRWRGLDVDFCRAIAAAVLGNANKVVFVPLKSSERFSALKLRTVDILARNTSWTMLREAALQVQFPAVLFYDGQGFMVAADSGVKAVADLSGATICVEKGTTHESNLLAYFNSHGMQVEPLIIDSANAAATTFFSGRCRAYTSDASQLAAMRLQAPTGPKSYAILPERISKEPLSPVVLRVDGEWVTIVRWVLFSLIIAEEKGITRENADAKIMNWSESERQIIAGGAGHAFADALGIPEGWGLRAIKAVGNYGEMYERNVGNGSALAIERGLNRLWSSGGLMYAPPLR